MRNLVICPNCEYNGRKQVLGAMSDQGDLVVLRFHKGETVVRGDQFEVICGGCGEIIYKKERRINVRTVSYNWFSWSYWGTANSYTGSATM